MPRLNLLTQSRIGLLALLFATVSPLVSTAQLGRLGNLGGGGGNNASVNTSNNSNQPAVDIERLPTTVEEFKTLRDRIATTPEGGAAAFVIALKMYFDNPAVGIQCVIMQCHLPTLSQGSGPNSYGGYTLGNSDRSTLETQRERSPWVMSSYFPGATPENNYQMPSGAFKLRFSTNNYSGNASEGTLKVFIPSSGADSPRPVTMVRNDRGVWKATMWSSLIVGCRPPASARPVDDL